MFNKIPNRKQSNHESNNATLNIAYVRDIENAIQINRWLLKPLGIWPMSLNKNNIEKYFSNVLVIIASTLLCFILIPGGLHTWIKEKNTKIRLKLIGILSFCVMAIIKYISLILNIDEIGECINHIIYDWRMVNSTNDRNIMLNFAQFGRYGAIICTVFMYGGGIFFAGVMPLLTGNIQINENITVRPLAYPGYYIVSDVQNTPIYEITFIIHCGCAFVMHSITTAVCSLAVVLVMHACGQLEIVMLWFDQLVKISDKNQNNNNLITISHIISHHIRTIVFIKTTQRIFRNICLVELVGCTLNLCLLGYDLLMEWQECGPIMILTYVILISSFLFNILLFCFIGELLAEKWRKVGETSYMIEWYELPTSIQKGLMLIIATSDIPTTLTAGKVIELSLETFCSVIRTAVAYLNMLRTLTT